MRIVPVAVVLIVIWSASSFAQTLRIAAAADLQQALPELVKAFRTKRPAVRIEAVYGSSGNFTTQIEQGAPYDVFFSADMRYPERLSASGLTTMLPRRYALGQLVVWAANSSRNALSAEVEARGIEALSEPHARRIAIANPAHAPYGERAKEALEASNLWRSVQKRLVLAENVAQAAQFAESVNADAALISLSLALTPTMQKAGKYALIDPKIHKPLQQGVVVLKRSVVRGLAEGFVRFVCSPEGALVLARYGFIAF